MDAFVEVFGLAVAASASAVSTSHLTQITIIPVDPVADAEHRPSSKGTRRKRANQEAFN